MRLLDVVTEPGDIGRVLGRAGPSARAPPPPDPTEQLELHFRAA